MGNDLWCSRFMAIRNRVWLLSYYVVSEVAEECLSTDVLTRSYFYS